MKLKAFFKLILISILAGIFFVPVAKSYFSDTLVITGNIFSTGHWDDLEKEIDIELKKPLDGHKYFLGQEIQILWKVHKAHPHSEFDFELYLLDDNEEESELLLENLDCGPTATAPVYEKWCKWVPDKTGDFKIRVEVKDQEGNYGQDENEEFFQVTQKDKPNNQMENELEITNIVDEDHPVD